MIINNSNLDILFTAFSAAFQGGLGTAESQYEKIVMSVPSATSQNTYGWLGSVPSLREWVGDRVIKNLSSSDYSIKNKTFESTVSVSREDIEDDAYGLYAPMFSDLGNLAREHPNKLVFDLLKNGHSRTCYDGQYFFDTDHVVAGASVSNSLSPGSNPGTPWYLLCTTRAVRPLIYQTRRGYRLTRMDKSTDETVFLRNSYLYGVDARVNVGFGLWQLAVRSTKTLDNDNYAEARAAMAAFKNDEDAPLGLVPSLLVVPPTLEAAARKVVVSAVAANGATNEWAGSAELLVSPWLA